MVKQFQFLMFFLLPFVFLVFACREWIFSGMQWRGMKKCRSLVSGDMGLVFISKPK